MRRIRLGVIWCAAALLAASACSDEEQEQVLEDSELGLTVGALPGGTAIRVSIDTPVNNQLVPPGPVPVSGSAAVAIGQVLADTAIIYVVDVSGSTEVGGGCGGDFNGDGASNTVLDCELAAVKALNDQAQALHTVGEVGLVVFGQTAAGADMSPSAGEQALTAPDAPADPVDPVRHVNLVLGSIDTASIGQFTPHAVGQLTNYSAAIDAAVGALAASTKPRKLVVYLSDGFPTAGDPIGPSLAAVPAGVHFFTFAVGSAARCVDSNPFGSLDQIASATGGNCTNVTDVATLPSILPGVIGSQLTALELTVDGAPVALDSLTPSLPALGPVDATYTASPVITAPGSHQICARAHGVDAGGPGSVAECVTVIVNRPPEAVCTDVTVVADALCRGNASVNAGSFDPDGNLAGCSQLPPGPYAGVGTTGVNLVCTDTFGASDACGASVTVVDRTAPAVTCPAPQVLECVGGGAVATFAPTVADNCGPTSASCAPPSGSTFPVGTTTATCTAVDGSGNASSCGFPVTVRDTAAPVVTVRPGRISLWPPNHDYRTISLADCVTRVTDACGGTLDIATAGRIVRVTSDESEQVNGSGNTCLDAIVTGRTTAQVRAERAGPRDGRVYRIHFVVTDAAGNQTAASCVAEVPHDQSGSAAVDSGCAYCLGDGCGSCPGPSPTCH